MLYENHEYLFPNLNVIFHFNTLKYNEKFVIHWHQNPELLLITKGILNATIDGNEYQINEGNMLIINNNQIHSLKSETDDVQYYCLIVDNDLVGNLNELPQSSDNRQAVNTYFQIINELSDLKPKYEDMVSGYIKVLFSILSREKNTYISEEANISKKVILVKQAYQFIYENCTKDITLESISEELGTSKFYLSHIFKEITGKTVISHLNYVRCKHARSLLKSGEFNVAESAYASGFNNLSYFSKTYKLIFGVSPIKDSKKE